MLFELVGVDDIVCNELCEDPILQAFLGLERGPGEISQSLSADVEYQPYQSVRILTVKVRAP